MTEDEKYRSLVAQWGRCACSADGCDEEGDPGCALCQHLDHEWPCPHDPHGGWPRDVVAGALIDGSGAA